MNKIRPAEPAKRLYGTYNCLLQPTAILILKGRKYSKLLRSSFACLNCANYFHADHGFILLSWDQLLACVG